MPYAIFFAYIVLKWKQKKIIKVWNERVHEKVKINDDY